MFAKQCHHLKKEGRQERGSSGGTRSLFLLGHKWGTITNHNWSTTVWVPALGYLRPARGRRRRNARGGDMVAPPEQGVWGCHPGKFLKICVQNPAFWCHVRQKVGLCWCEIMVQ